MVLNNIKSNINDLNNFRNLKNQGCLKVRQLSAKYII